MIKLPAFVENIIDVLEENGFEAYVVGGSLRDIYLGGEPHDWDVCTSAMPEETVKCFEGYRIIETGMKHGTVTVMDGGNPVEITTYRIDGDYKDCRHPDNVTFTKNIEEDLKRRDFTVNAMAYSPKRGFVDCCGSRQDIENGIIRCVGNAEQRFKEDALRIMRCMRFSAVLGFKVDAETEEAAKKLSCNLPAISKERVWAELKKMLCAKDGVWLSNVLRKFTPVLEVLFPQITPAVGFPHNNPHHIYDVWEHILQAVSESVNDIDVRTALLFHDLGKPCVHTVDEKGISHFKQHQPVSEIIASEILTALKVDNKTKDTVCLLVKHHDDKIENTPPCVKRWLRKIGEENFFKLLEIKRADIKAHAPEWIKNSLERCDDIEETARKVILEKQCFKMSDMKINGNDVMSLGVRSGKQVGHVLNTLLEMVISEEIENEREKLLTKARVIVDGNV